jgi:hypothetical protein
MSSQALRTVRGRRLVDVCTVVYTRAGNSPKFRVSRSNNTGNGTIKTLVVTDQETTRLPVRSALFKQRTGGLVVRWVTTSEYPLLYVFVV